MNVPNLTTPGGVYEYLIASVLIVTLTAVLWVGAVWLGLLPVMW
jgi:hypothetical protein